MKIMRAQFGRVDWSSTASKEMCEATRACPNGVQARMSIRRPARTEATVPMAFISPTRASAALLTGVPAYLAGRRLGQRQQVVAFVRLEEQGASDRREDLGRGCGGLTLLDAGVVPDADAGQHRELLAAQPGDATLPVGLQPDPSTSS